MFCRCPSTVRTDTKSCYAIACDGMPVAASFATSRSRRVSGSGRSSWRARAFAGSGEYTGPSRRAPRGAGTSGPRERGACLGGGFGSHEQCTDFFELRRDSVERAAIVGDERTRVFGEAR